MSQSYKDIKDLDLLPTVSDEDRILMTKASDGHSAVTLKVTDLKSHLEESMGGNVKKSGDTMTGILHVMDGGTANTGGIQTNTGNGLVMYKGASQTTLGMLVGTTVVRSGETDLLHCRANTNYIIHDDYNRPITFFRKGLKTLAEAQSTTSNASGTWGQGSWCIQHSGYSTHLLSFCSSGSARVSQLWFNHYGNNANVLWRNSTDNNLPASWNTFLDSKNYTSYTVKKDGTGASGTWAINVSGNAASATKLESSRTLWGQSFNGTGNVDGTLILNAPTSGNYTEGVRINSASGNWSILALGGIGNSGTSEYTWLIGKNTAADFIIDRNGSAGTNGLIIKKNGYMGLGATSPVYKLHVNGDTYTTGWMRSGSGFFVQGSPSVHYTKHSYGDILELNTGLNEMCIGNSGGVNMHINYRKPTRYTAPTNWYIRNGTSTGWASLNIGSLTANGNIVATGEITAYGSSDIRLKTNIQKLSGLNLLRKTKTYTFDWTDEALTFKTNNYRNDEGFIAQEIEEIAPHFVTHNMWGKGYMGLDKTKFIPYLVAGVNELDDEVSILKKKVDNLENENRELRKLIKSLLK